MALCFCCRPDCYDCHPDLWMAAVNADFAANSERYQREYDEAEAVPMSEEDVARMMAKTWAMIEQSAAEDAARKKIAGAN